MNYLNSQIVDISKPPFQLQDLIAQQVEISRLCPNKEGILSILEWNKDKPVSVLRQNGQLGIQMQRIQKNSLDTFDVKVEA